jgi:hypothetical protein
MRRPSPRCLPVSGRKLRRTGYGGAVRARSHGPPVLATSTHRRGRRRPRANSSPARGGTNRARWPRFPAAAHGIGHPPHVVAGGAHIRRGVQPDRAHDHARSPRGGDQWRPVLGRRVGVVPSSRTTLVPAANSSATTRRCRASRRRARGRWSLLTTTWVAARWSATHVDFPLPCSPTMTTSSCGTTADPVTALMPGIPLSGPRRPPTNPRAGDGAASAPTPASPAERASGASPAWCAVPAAPPAATRPASDRAGRHPPTAP